MQKYKNPIRHTIDTYLRGVGDWEVESFLQQKRDESPNYSSLLLLLPFPISYIMLFSQAVG